MFILMICLIVIVILISKLIILKKLINKNIYVDLLKLDNTFYKYPKLKSKYSLLFSRYEYLNNNKDLLLGKEKIYN